MKKIDELLKKYDVQAMNNDKFREELFVLFGVSKCGACGKNEPEICGSCVSDIAQATGEQAQQSF